MDILLSKVTQQAMNYAIRSGVTITASYALRQSARLLKQVKSTQREELVRLQEKLQKKIKIISPAIDMIELISARGNTSLESAVSLTKELRWEIQSLGQRLATAASEEEAARRGSAKAKTQVQTDIELKLVAEDIKRLIGRIDDAIPLINLAITTSGARLSSSLPLTVSPSRLLQASTFLTAADTLYCMAPTRMVPVGPTFTLSMYMLFEGHVRPQDQEDIRQATWKEVIHKARVKIRRTPMDVAFGLPNTHGEQQSNVAHQASSASTAPGRGEPVSYMGGEARVDEYAYQLLIVEDLDDDRMHEFQDDEEKPGPYDTVDLAGIREIVPIHEISKIFYADTGKILNIGADGESNNPVLLVKRDINAIPPRRMMEREAPAEYQFDEEENDADETDEIQSQLDAQLRPQHNDDPETPLTNGTAADSWRLPSGLDPEWIAFEVYTEAEESDTESELDPSSNLPSQSSREPSLDPSVADAFSALHLNSTPDQRPRTPSSSSPAPHNQQLTPAPMRLLASNLSTPPPLSFHNIRTSLSLLEMLLRLTSLQQFQQQSHLSINDELLNFFLEESSATGAGGDEAHRQRVRADARRRVGWDPYDESPMKRRGEDYQYGNGGAGWEDGPAGRWGAEGEGYGSNRSPRYSQDRGYPLRSREQTPETPPLMIYNRSSRGSTPANEPQRPSLPKSPSTPSGGQKGRQAFLRRRTDGQMAERRGSPLARPGTGVTDEGLGTSPGSHTEVRATVEDSEAVEREI